MRFSRYFSVLLACIMILEMVAGVVDLAPQKALASGESWYATGGTWLYRKQITIDHTKVADVATPSTTYANFPVLISLDALSNIQANGTDIRFTSSDGTTELPREIESYSSGSLRAWVKTTLTKDSSDSTDDIIYMYYGNSSATSEPAANSTYGSQNVWKTDGVDTSNVMTQHMKDTTTSTITDSTSNANNGTKVAANEPIQADAQIAKGQTFDGVNDYVNAGNGASLNITNAITVEAWVKTSAASNDIVRKPDWGANSGYGMYTVSDGVRGFIGNGTGYVYSNSGAKVVNDNLWHHAVLVITPTTMTTYADGLANTPKAHSGILTSSANLLIANAAAVGYFSGSIDEVRIYNRALTAQEITTQYNNTNSPSTFYTLGIEEKQSPVALTSWGYRKAITIDHTKVASDQTNFPVLINLPTDANLASHALSTGNDILFTSSSTTWASGTENNKLAHEIEKYTTATGELEAWVRIPTLSSTVDTVIYLYYGNASATSQQNKTVVWDGSTKMVAHLPETGNGTAGEYKDSTSNANNGRGGGGTSAAVPTATASGQIDGAQTFDGVNDYVDMGSGSNLHFSGPFSVESWVNIPVTPSHQDAMIIADYIGDYRGYKFSVNASRQLYFTVGRFSDSSMKPVSSTQVLSFNTWYHVVAVYDGIRPSVYVNTVKTDGDLYSPIEAGTGAAIMGRDKWWPDGSHKWFNGSIDEVRVYNRALTAQEITTQYNNEFSPSTFVKTLGAEEPKISATAPTATQATDGTGYVTISTVIEDSTDANTLRFKVEYSLDGGSTWTSGDPFLTSFITTSPSQGTQPDVTNAQTYQVGMPTNNIVTSAGANTVTVKWDSQSASNGTGALGSQANVKLRITPSDGTSDGTMATSAASFAIDNTAPTGGSIQINSNNANTPSKDTTLTLSAVGATQMKFSNDNSTYSTYEAYATSKAWDITNSSYGGTSSQGTKTVYVKYIDSFGNEALGVNDTIVYDTTAPSTPGTPSTTTPTNSSSQTWSWSAATDTLSGVVSYAWRVTTSLGAAVTNGTTSSLSVVTNLAEGAYNFLVKAIDNATNQGSESSGAVTVDTTPPVTTDSGIDTNWHNSNVTVTLNCTDSASGCNHTYYTTDGTTPTTSSSQGTSILLTTNGQYTVKYFSTDLAGNTETAKTAANTVKIDTTSPSTPGTPTTLSPTNNTTPSWTWSASTDSASGLASPAYTLQWSKDSAFASGVYLATSTTNSYTHTNDLTNGTWYMRVKATDIAGNSSAFSSNGSVVVNTSAPSGSVTINTGDTYTNTTGVTLTISASDNVDSASQLQMEISNSSDFSGATYESFMTSKAWTLASTDGEKTVYVRIKDTSGNVGTYSDTITLDTTAPNAFDLDSPGNDSYTNNERPTFRWKAATTGDALSGLSKYKLEVDNGDPSAGSGHAAGDFTIDGISVSRTTDYETTKYLVHYDGFSDTDSANNYISVYTKHSVDWGSSENDGKLNPGKRTWKVIAYDNAGNTRDASRSLYADYTNPSLSNTAILESDILGTKDGYTVVSTLKPIFTGSISDNYSPGKVEISFSKQNFFLGIETGRTLFLKETFDLKNTSNNTTLIFSLSPSQDIEYGKYRVDIAGIDKAGNRSEVDSFNLWVLSNAQAKLILTQGKTKEETKKITDTVNKAAQVSLPELEKKAILRREKEASEFSKLTQGFGDSINVMASGVKQSLYQLALNFFSIFNSSVSNIENMAGSVIHTIASAFNAMAGGVKNIYLAISNTGKNISGSIDTAISNAGKVLIAWTGNAGNAYRRTAKATPGIIGDAMLYAGDTAGRFVAFNYKLGSDFAREQEKIQKQIGKTQKETEKDLRTSAQNTQLFFAAISDGISGVNKELDRSQESVKKQISKANKNTSDTISGIIADTVFTIGERVQDFSDKTGFAIVDFGYIFVNEPTKIAEVKVVKATSTSVTIAWTTNHPANGKVNYGLTADYGQDMQSEKRMTYHEFTIKNLKANTTYHYEVMSHNKNYVYDANHEFTTPKE